MKTLLLFLFLVSCLLGFAQGNFVVNQDTAGAKITKLQIKKAFDKCMKTRVEARAVLESLDRNICGLGGDKKIDQATAKKNERIIDSLVKGIEASDNQFHLSKKEIEKDSTQTLHNMFAAFKAKYPEYQNAKLISGDAPEKDSIDITEKFIAFLEEEI